MVIICYDERLKERSKVKSIIIAGLIVCIFNTAVYAGSKDRTPWHKLEKHWNESKTKDDDLCLEYMRRVEHYDYIVPHKNPIRKVAVLPPAMLDILIDKHLLNIITYFEKEVLFNMQEIEDEYQIEPKKWKVTKSFKESYKILKENDLYDKYLVSIQEFITYRIIDKKLFSEMAKCLDVDTVLLVLGRTFLIDAKEGKIISEDNYCILDKKDCRKVFETMPIE